MWLPTNEKATDNKVASYPFRQPDNHPNICFSLPFIWQKLHSINNNTVRTDILDKAEEYKWSLAADYFYGKRMGRVRIEWLDAMLVTV